MTSTTDTPGTAVVTYLRPAARDHAYLLDAVCQTCSRDVLHGAGSDLDAVPDFLGDRRCHCTCAPGAYSLIDPEGVIPRRTAVIRAEEKARAARRTERHRLAAEAAA